MLRPFIGHPHVPGLAGIVFAPDDGAQGWRCVTPASIWATVWVVGMSMAVLLGVGDVCGHHSLERRCRPSGEAPIVVQRGDRLHRMGAANVASTDVGSSR